MSDIHDRHPSEDLLQAFLDGEVPKRERRRVEEHIASCTRCAEELSSWRLLFEDLDSLGSHRPSADFEGRVMAGVHVPQELPWAARVKARLGSLLKRARPEHLPAEVLQDLADGALRGRRSARARDHLEGCATCAAELAAWTTVMARLSDLHRLAPAPGFADRVMEGLAASAARQTAAAPAAADRSGWKAVLAGAKRLVPRTRRAWAAISGAAVTPAVTFGLVLWAVFSHPTLTPQALASFAFWQLTDLAVAGWSGLVATGLELAGVAELTGLVEAVLAAPLVAVGGVTLYCVAFTLAVRVLYKNLIVSRSVRHRYAPASVS